MRALARASLTKNKGFDLYASEASTALYASGASYKTHKTNGFDFCAQRSKHNIRWRFPSGAPAERGKSSRQLSEADKANRRYGGWVCPRSVPKGASSEALRASPQGERKTHALECKNVRSHITTCLSHLISLHLLSQRCH